MVHLDLKNENNYDMMFVIIYWKHICVLTNYHLIYI